MLSRQQEDDENYLVWLRRRLAEVEATEPPTRLSRAQANSFRVMIHKVDPTL